MPRDSNNFRLKESSRGDDSPQGIRLSMKRLSRGERIFVRAVLVYILLVFLEFTFLYNNEGWFLVYYREFGNRVIFYSGFRAGHACGVLWLHQRC